MAEQVTERSLSTLSPDKSGSAVLPRSFKAASSILKSLSNLDARRSQSSELIHKSVSIVASDKFDLSGTPDVQRKESKLSVQPMNEEKDREREESTSRVDLKTGKTVTGKKQVTQFMRKYPELFRDDVSINPSYTGLRNFPYNVACRQRFHKNKSKINRQLNREIELITLMQTLALEGVRVERIFTVGFHPKATIVSDFATPSERSRLNELLRESCGSAPLAIWDKQVKNGYIKRITDDEVKSLVLEIAGTNVATTFISCPQDPKKVLGIKLPFLIMIIKNMKKYFTFEITILDDKDMHRRFRVSNFQSTTRVRPFCTTMPIGLSGGWNQIQFNLADFTRRAYGSNYVETTRMQIHANCRIRRIYYADRLYSEDEMPEEYKLFLPIRRRKSMRETRESKSVSNNKNNNGGDGERLPDEPPPFASAPEGEESQGPELGRANDPGDEVPREYSQKRISETRYRSDLPPQKSASTISRRDSRRKSASVTIKEKSQDEFIAPVQEEPEIPAADDGEEEEENIINVEEHPEDGEAPQEELQTEELTELTQNTPDEG